VVISEVSDRIPRRSPEARRSVTVEADLGQPGRPNQRPGTKKESVIMTGGTVLMHDDSSTTDLVIRAKNGDKRAWDALVERYAPLVWSVCRRNRLGGGDDDVFQTVWLQLVAKLATIRDPAALPGWLVTTTQRECCQFMRTTGRRNALERVPDPDDIPDQTGAVEQELLAAELGAALREAFSQLPPGYQQLIALLIQDPPVPYAEISARLGIPVGSIGPIRGRCLNKLRRHPAVAALINPEAEAPHRETLYLNPRP
jgi:RNA polymerase sigma factor (sigma-70 family)